ncbi:MAG: glycosyltransferase family 2 protein [Muribaculaceae bacterium]|nr:glycosyltransferase family 2 protein [Muribaculaceae bacterium]
MAKVAVVILNWNGEKLLKEFLPKVIENTNREIGRIIVADNGSTDSSVDLIENDFPEVEIMRFDENHGFAGGYNLALSKVDEEYAVLLNSDVAPGKEWLDTLYSYMETHHRTGACQPKILSYKEPEKFEYAGACGGFIDKHGYTYCRGRIFDTCERDNGQYDTVMKVFWATGAALMIQTELYRKAGGLDERFFAHMEEIDLCWRIQLAGYDIAVVPKSVVYHLGGGSLPASNPKKTYLNFRNNLLMLHKNLPDATRRRKLLVRRLLDTVAWAKFMATLDFRNANAIWRAHNDFRKMTRDYAEHPQTDLLDTRTDTHHNILTDYFLRGRKTWNRVHR